MATEGVVAATGAAPVAAATIPPRLKRWILIWTPVIWLVLELCTYPKDVALSSGFVEIVKGFFAESVACYPAWALFFPAVLITTAGVVGLVRQRKGRRFPVALLILGLAFCGWTLWAGGFPSFSFSASADSLNWLWQTVCLVLAAGCVWTWGQTNPERAELTVWNSRQVWRLYRANWQGMVGLWILIIFAAIALLAPFLADHSYLSPTKTVGIPYSPPSFSDYYLWLGTSELGQSVLAQFIWSARISLVVGLLATAISTVLGAVIGIAAGYYGGWRGEVSMRVTDAFLVVPWLPLAMVLAAAWGTNYLVIMLIIGITSWPGTARVVRSQVLSVKELPFIERARAIGSRSSHIMNKHILPNVFAILFANTILVVAIAILSETTLSFLGLGDPLRFSWGTMLHYVWASGGSTLPAARAYVLAPGLAIVAVVVAFTFIGTAFDEVLDPKLRKREAGGASPAREDSAGPAPTEGWFERAREEAAGATSERPLTPAPGGSGTVVTELPEGWQEREKDY